MRVTEQIDALETLAYDPIAYLMVPRLIAGVTMVPLLTIVAIAVGICAGGLAVIGRDERAARRLHRGAASHVQHLPGLVRADQGDAFGGAIAFDCSYEGFITESGAEGVGRSTARAVVISSVVILLLDALTALYLANRDSMKTTRRSRRRHLHVIAVVVAIAARSGSRGAASASRIRCTRASAGGRT